MISTSQRLRACATVGLLAVATLVTLTACAPQPGAGTSEDKPQVLSIGAGVGDKIDSLWINSGTPEQTLVFRSLFLAQPNLTDVEPDLASDYEVSDDGKTIVVTVRDDVKWHDGEPFTAQDVTWSLTTALRAAQINALYASELGKINGAAAVTDGTADTLAGVSADGNTVTIELSEPSANFIPVMAQFAILPQHLLKDSDPLELHNDAFWSAPVGNGMYEIAELNPSNFIRLTPAETYEGTQPKIDEVVIKPTADPVSDAQSGAIDYFWSNDVSVVERMAGVDGFTTHETDVLFYRYFVLNLDGNPLLEDVRVREALLHAIDRDGIAKSIYGGVAKVINSGVPADDPAALENAETFDYDPELARTLLDEADFDFSQTLRLRMYYGDPVSQAFMTAVSQQLQDIGIDVELLKFQGDATTELYQNRQYDVALKGLSGFSAAEWYQEYSGTNFLNIVGDQPEVRALTSELTQSVDEDARKSALGDLQAWEQENLLKLPLFTLAQFHYISDDVNAADKWGNPFYRYDRDFETWTVD